MKPLRVLVTATAIAVPLCVLGPASPASADTLPDDAITVTFPEPVLYTGGWSEGTVRLTNKTQSTLTDVHPWLRVENAPFDPKLAGSALVEYAEGDGGAWKPLAVKTQGQRHDVVGDLGPAAGMTLPAGYDHTWRVRVRLPQTSVEGPTEDISVSLVVSKGWTPEGGSIGIEGMGHVRVPVTGLETSFTGLPKQVPANARPHEFQVRLKTKNKADWHLDKASFGMDLSRSMNGTSACDARIEVKDPQGTWHNVKNDAAGWDTLDVDLAKWATGPVDDRTLHARISIGGGYATPIEHELHFGYYPGAGPNNFFETLNFATVAVPGAAKCVGGEGTPVPTTPATAAPGATTPATTAPSQPATVAPIPPAQAKPELAATGDDSGNTTTLIGLTGALVLAAGAAGTFLLRRRRT